MRFRRATVDDSRRLDAQTRAHKAAGAGGGLEEERERRWGTAYLPLQCDSSCKRAVTHSRRTIGKAQLQVFK